MSQFWNTLEQFTKQADARNLLKVVEDKFDKVLAGNSEDVVTAAGSEAPQQDNNLFFSEYGVFEVPPKRDSAPPSAFEIPEISSSKLFSKLNAAVGRALQSDPDTSSISSDALVSGESATTSTGTEVGNNKIDTLKVANTYSLVQLDDTPESDQTKLDQIKVDQIKVDPDSIQNKFNDLIDQAPSLETESQGAETVSAISALDDPSLRVAKDETEMECPPENAGNDTQTSVDSKALASEAPAAVQNYLNKIKSLERQLGAERTRAEQLYKEAQKLSKENGTLSQRSKELAKNLTQTQSKLEQSQSQISKLSVLADDQTAKIAVLEKAERALTAKETQISQLTKQLEYVRVERDQAKNMSDQKTTQTANELKKAKLAAEEKLASLEKSSSEKEQELTNELGKLRGALSRLNEEIYNQQEDFSSQIEQLQGQLAVMKLQSDELRAGAQEQSRPLLLELEQLRQQLEAAAVVIGSKDSAIAVARKERDSFAQSLALLQTQAESAKAHAAKQFDEIDSLRRKLAEQAAELISKPTLTAPQASSAATQCDFTIPALAAEAADAFAQTESVLVSHLSTDTADLNHTEDAILSMLPEQDVTRTSSSSSLQISSPSAGRVAHQLHQEHAFIQKQLTLELETLQTQLKMAQQQRDSFRSEVVSYSIQAQQATAALKEVEMQLEEFEQKYNASILLLGQKSEQLNEALQDAKEAKEAYKDQLEDLISQLAQKQV